MTTLVYITDSFKHVSSLYLRNMMKKWSSKSFRLVFTLILATVLWYFTFAVEAGNFWIKISCSAASLAILAWLFSGKELKRQFAFRKSHLLAGLVSAMLLYLIFWMGNLVLTSLFQSAKSSISDVYASREGLPGWSIALLLLFVTSPAEEIFWRGFVQRIFMQKLPPVTGFLLAACCYAGVHICSRNVPLILAAFVAGCFWGLLYVHQKSLIPVILSHALWSVTVFLIFPFG